MTDAILFDVDGTLWDTTDLVAHAWNMGARELGAKPKEPITGDRLKKEFGKPMDIIVENLFPGESKEMQEQILRVCCKHEHRILEETKEHLLYPGVADTIKKLSKICKVCIVSNCQKGYIELFLEKNGLGPYVTDFESFGNTGLSKGDNIRLVVERNQIEHGIYVGDTKGDYDAAAFAGVPFVLARYGFGHVPQAEAGIDSIEQILGFA